MPQDPRVDRGRPSPVEQDVAIGLIVTGAQVAARAGRLAFVSARAVARAPVIAPLLRTSTRGLAATGRDARLRSRTNVARTAEDLFAAPVVGDIVDAAFAGPLPEDLGRSLSEHAVARRVAAEATASPELRATAVAVLEAESSRRLVRELLDSDGFEQIIVDALGSELTDKLIRSPEFEQLLVRVLSSPQVRAALMESTGGFAEQFAAAFRRRAAGLDDHATVRTRRWLHLRPLPSGPDTPPLAGAGLASRGLAMLLDLLAAWAIFAIGGVVVGLLAAAFGGIKPAWVTGVIAAVGWTLILGSYLVLCWTSVGQTPGMRIMSVRVVRNEDGAPPGLGRSIVRLVGLALAVIPLLAGLLPILPDRRRRGLQDMLAGTVVLHEPPRL